MKILHLKNKSRKLQFVFHELKALTFNNIEQNIVL